MFDDNIKIIKIMEEESKDTYLVVRVPFGCSKTFEEACEMGAKYANLWLSELEDKENYDEYFDEMAEYREGTSGEDTFIYYLRKLGYDVEYLETDFEFRW